MKAKKIKHNGLNKTINEWAEHLGISSATIRSRLHSGKALKDVLSNDVRCNQYE